MSCESLGTRLRILESVLLGATCKQTVAFDVLTMSAAFTDAVTVPIDDGQVALVEVDVICRSVDGLGRAAFRRIGLFYREGGDVQIQRIWHTIFTERSSPGFDLDFQLNAENVRFRVKAASASTVSWTGCVSLKYV